LAVVLITTCIRRRRAKRFDDDVAAAAAAAYRDADGYWERENNWNEGNPASAYTSSAYTDGTHGVHNEHPMAVPQADYQNYPDTMGYNNANNYSGAGGYGAGGGYPGAGGEAYGMNNLSGIGVAHGDPNYGAAGIGAGAYAAGAGAYAAHHARQTSPPPPNDLYQGYADMGMNDSLEGGRYPVPPIRSRSFNQGQPQQPAQVGRSSSGSSSGNTHGAYGYPYQPGSGNGGPAPPLVNRTGSKSPPQGYSHSYGTPLPQMQEHHNEGDAYDGLSHESEHHGQEHGNYGDVEDMPRVLRVANE